MDKSHAGRARASWSAVLWAQEEPEEGQAGRDHPGAPGRFVQVRTVSCCDSVCTRARSPTRPSQNDTREAWRATWSEMPVVFCIVSSLPFDAGWAAPGWFRDRLVLSHSPRSEERWSGGR